MDILDIIRKLEKVRDSLHVPRNLNPGIVEKTAREKDLKDIMEVIAELYLHVDDGR